MPRPKKGFTIRTTVYEKPKRLPTKLYAEGSTHPFHSQNLQALMGLGENDYEYKQILSAMETTAENFLDPSCSYKDQPRAKLNTYLNKVARKVSTLNMYEDKWPALAYALYWSQWGRGRRQYLNNQKRSTTTTTTITRIGPPRRARTPARTRSPIVERTPTPPVSIKREAEPEHEYTDEVREKTVPARADTSFTLREEDLEQVCTAPAARASTFFTLVEHDEEQPVPTAPVHTQSQSSVSSTSTSCSIPTSSGSPRVPPPPPLNSQNPREQPRLEPSSTSSLSASAEASDKDNTVLAFLESLASPHGDLLPVFNSAGISTATDLSTLAEMHAKGDDWSREFLTWRFRPFHAKLIRDGFAKMVDVRQK